MAELYAECRALGHEWHHLKRKLTDAELEGIPAPPIAAGWMAAVVAMSTCAECGAVRVKWIGRAGSQGANRYLYPPGYTRTGENRLSRDEWRRAWIESIEA